MNELGYKLIVDKTIKRKIDIINLLLTNDSYLTIDLMSKKLETSVKTISVDIVELNSELPLNVSITNTPSEGAKLKSDNPFYLTDFINDFFEKNPLNTVIDAIFNNEKCSLDDYAFETHTSHSSMRRFLNKWRSILRDYNLDLQYAPYVRLIGKETDIRFFFFQYFRHAHGQSLVLPSSTELNDTYANLQKISALYGSALNLDFYRFSHWLLIAKKRIGLECYVTLPKETIEKHVNTQDFKTIKAIFVNTFIKDSVFDSLPIDEYVYIFLTRLDTLIYELDNVFFMMDYTDYLRPFTHVSQQFFKEEGLHLVVHANLKITLESFLANTLLISDLTPSFQKVSSSLKIHAKKTYANVFSHWHRLLEQEVAPSVSQFSYLEDITTSLTLITASYLTLQEHSQLNVLFSLTGTPSSLNYYKKMILSILPNQVNAIFLYNKPLNDNLLDALSIDTCVYNHPLVNDITVAKKIRLSNVPTEVEWGKLLSNLIIN